MYYLMTYLCFFAFEPTAGLSMLAGLVVFVFGGWGIVIPSPGGMGTYHFLAQTALSIYGVSGCFTVSVNNIYGRDQNYSRSRQARRGRRVRSSRHSCVARTFRCHYHGDIPAEPNCVRLDQAPCPRFSSEVGPMESRFPARR